MSRKREKRLESGLKHQCACKCTRFYLIKKVTSNGKVQNGLYCDDCGAWQEWLPQQENGYFKG